MIYIYNILSIQSPLFPFSCFFSAIQVFDNAGIANFLDAVLDGYHATVFAYGPGPGLGRRLVDRGSRTIWACVLLGYLFGGAVEITNRYDHACSLQRFGDPGNFG